jgi:23S rRNA (cytidine1920-2'-O)/16S rRNA (cytidine1409-2'-O)-methyltransferase
MDVSFISATLVLPAVIRAAFQGHTGELVTLIKPQFEVGREHVGKGGIVRDAAAHAASIDKVRATVTGLGGATVEVIDSPITGVEGNREFLLHAIFSSSPS